MNFATGHVSHHYFDSHFYLSSIYLNIAQLTQCNNYMYWGVLQGLQTPHGGLTVRVNTTSTQVYKCRKLLCYLNVESQ